LTPYYSTTLDEYFPGKPNFCYGNSSFLGPVDIRPPLKDFYVRTSNTGIGVENQILVFAFSRVTSKRNELCVQVRFSPTSVPIKSARIIVDSINYFITKIPLSATVGEAHTVVHEIAGFYQIARQRVKRTIGEGRVYGTDGSVDRKSLNTY
jgi:hypothetical protein